MLVVLKILLQRKTGALVDFSNLPKMLEKYMNLFTMRDYDYKREALAKNLSKKLQFS